MTHPNAVLERYPVATVLYMQHNLETALNGIAAAGFPAVEIWGDRTHLDPRLKPDISALRAQLARLGLHTHSLHAPYEGLKLGHPDPAFRPQALAVLGRTLEYAAELGAGIVVIHVTSDTRGLADADYSASRESVIDYIGALQPRAAALGIRLALENLPQAYGHRRFGASLQEICAAFPGDDMGFCLDIGHVLVNGLSLSDEIRAAGARLISIHAHNNDGKHDAHWLPNIGQADWGAVRRDLAGIRYAGAYVLEVINRADRVEGPDPDPDSVLAQTAAFARADAAL